MPEVIFRNTIFKQHGRDVLSAINIHIEEGQHYCLHGPNGAGKTMLLKALAGRFPATDGVREFRIGNNVVNPAEFNHNVGRMFFSESEKAFKPAEHFYQQRYQYSIASDSITCRELLEESGFQSHFTDHFELVKRSGCKEILERHVIKVSSGQRRKLYIVKALLKNPKLLLLDDPYIGMDAVSRDDFNLWIQEICSERHIQLIISGRPDDFPTFIHQEIVMNEKEVVYVGGKRMRSIPKPDFSKEDIGSIKQYWGSKELTKFNTILKLDCVSVKYDDVDILNDLSWEVRQAERVALIGKNGEGKSTLLSLLNADNPLAYINDIWLFDQKRGPGQSIWDIKRHTGFTSSELHVYFNGNLRLWTTVATGFLDSQYLSRRLTVIEDQMVHAFLQYFGLLEKKDIPFKHLSVGEQSLALFIRAIIKCPELLLLDEPYQGMDDLAIARCNHLLSVLLENTRHTLVFITHYTNEIPNIVSLQYLINNGQVLPNV
ncbi:MAG: ATP-binding cassette domain-containing protein [Cyclobacteriaceae bacterium]